METCSCTETDILTETARLLNTDIERIGARTFSNPIQSAINGELLIEKQNHLHTIKRQLQLLTQIQTLGKNPVPQPPQQLEPLNEAAPDPLVRALNGGTLIIAGIILATIFLPILTIAIH